MHLHAFILTMHLLYGREIFKMCHDTPCLKFFGGLPIKHLPKALQELITFFPISLPAAHCTLKSPVGAHQTHRCPRSLAHPSPLDWFLILYDLASMAPP